jgi:hypothetical protein
VQHRAVDDLFETPAELLYDLTLGEFLVLHGRLSAVGDGEHALGGGLYHVVRDEVDGLSAVRRPPRPELHRVPRRRHLPLRLLMEAVFYRAPQALLLHRILDVPAPHAFAIVRTRDLRLVTLAVVLQTAGPLAVAPFRVLPDRAVPRHVLRLADLRPEGVRVPLQTRLDRPLPVVLVLQVVEAVHAVAHVAELAVGEAVAVQLQALALGAVARLPRSHPVRLQVGFGSHGQAAVGGDLFGDGGVAHRNRHFRVELGLDVAGQHHHLAGGDGGFGGDALQRFGGDGGAARRRRRFQFGEDYVGRRGLHGRLHRRHGGRAGGQCVGAGGGYELYVLHLKEKRGSAVKEASSGLPRRIRSFFWRTVSPSRQIKSNLFYFIQKQRNHESNFPFHFLENQQKM